MNKFALFYRLLEKYELIYVFTHQYPDSDALNSQLALIAFVQDNYPEKTVSAVISENQELASWGFGVILDCSNAGRVVGVNYKMLEETLLIDHHPNSEQFCNYSILDEKAAATGEILAELFLSRENIVSATTAQYLYQSIVGDSLNFTIAATSAKTLLLAAELLKKGADVSLAQDKLFHYRENEFNFLTALRSIASNDGGLLHLRLSKEDVADFNVSMDFAKEGIKEFQSLSSAKIIALFYENDNGLYNCSLRSKDIVINEVAEQFGGGGHRFASGVKDLLPPQEKELLRALKKLL